VPHLGAYASIFGPGLLISVALVGGTVAVLRHRSHPVDQATATLISVGSMLLGLVLTALLAAAPLPTTTAVVGVLGTTATVRSRTRASLIEIGEVCLSLLISSTPRPAAPCSRGWSTGPHTSAREWRHPRVSLA
jgi:hypothetical protein